MSDESRPSVNEGLPHHILSASGTMIGICTTLIGLVKLLEPHIGPSRVDEFASLVLLMFFVSAIASYASIRCAKRQRLSRRCEGIADIFFLVGLFSSAAIAVLFAYEVI